ncbi:MAG TPA: diacylglycerol kinase family protein [Nitrososphaeraceae archaeon]|nr:diacylglycerol kinase family protein [Nitrososphaeraceae archaeon]
MKNTETAAEDNAAPVNTAINTITSSITQNENKGNISKCDCNTVIVVNPTSSSGSTGKGWDDLYSKIKEAFGNETPEVVFTTKAGDGTTLTRKFLKKGFKRVVAMGGDGTINEVVNGFFSEEKNPSSEASSFSSSPVSSNEGGSSSLESNNNNNNFKSATLYPISPQAIMGLFPSGTRNVLAKSLDFPEEVMECCNNFIKGKTQKIDVISATATDPNDHLKAITKVLLNAAEIGFGAEVIDKSKKMRNKINSRIVSTVASIATTLPGYESNLCEVIVDDGREKVLLKMTMGIIANGKFIGGGFMAAPQASVSDGLLDIVILKDSDSITMLDELVNMKNGKYSDESDIFYMQSRKVSIHSKDGDVPVTIDGEPIGILPATFQILEKALTVGM